MIHRCANKKVLSFSYPWTQCPSDPLLQRRQKRAAVKEEGGRKKEEREKVDVRNTRCLLSILIANTVIVGYYIRKSLAKVYNLSHFYLMRNNTMAEMLSKFSIQHLQIKHYHKLISSLLVDQYLQFIHNLLIFMKHFFALDQNEDQQVHQHCKNKITLFIYMFFFFFALLSLKQYKVIWEEKLCKIRIVFITYILYFPPYYIGKLFLSMT